MNHNILDLTTDQLYGNNKYKTSTFCIFLDGDVDINNFETELEANQSLFALYLHEYIHFIQEISTVYGLMKLSNVILYPKLQAYTAIQDRKKVIPIPAKGRSDINLNSYTKRNYDILPYYMGNMCNLTAKFDKKSVSITKHKIDKVKIPNIPNTTEVVILTIVDPNGNSTNVTFGGEILCESMASICEELYRKECSCELETNDYPYHILELLTHELYPELEKDKNWLFTISFLCLLRYTNPGYRLYNLIMRLKEINFLLNASFNRLIEEMEELAPRQYSIKVMHDEILREFDQVYNAAFYISNRKWMKDVFERIKLLSDNPLIIQSFIQYSDGNISYLARQIMHMLGHPTVKNSSFRACLKPPVQSMNLSEVLNINLFFFEAYKEVWNALRVKKYACRMVDDCIKSKIINNHSIVNGVCNEQKRIYEGETIPQLCPFGVIWKGLGLWGKKPNGY